MSSGTVEERAMQARTTTSTGVAQMLQMLAQRLRRGAMALAEGSRRLLGEPYRPEKHYMRGPGPKWRAKYGKAKAAHGAAHPQDATRDS